MQAVTSELQQDRALGIRAAAKAAREAAEHLTSLIDAAVKDGEPIPDPLAHYARQTEFDALMAQSHASEYCLTFLQGVAK